MGLSGPGNAVRHPRKRMNAIMASTAKGGNGRWSASNVLPT